MSNPGDKLPARNLPGSAEAWGRAIEARIKEIEKSLGVSQRSLNTVFRSSSGQSATIEDQIRQLVQTQEETKQALDVAGSTNTTYYGVEPPETQYLKAGDLWFDAGNGNRVMEWTGDEWVPRLLEFEALDTVVTDAIDQAVIDSNNALQTASDAQDMAGNAQDVADQAAQDALEAVGLVGGKGKVIFGSNPPAPEDQLEQNLWIDTTGGANTPKRWNGSTWVAVTDKAAVDAANAAAAAQITANEAFSAATAAATAAGNAQTAANSKNRVWYQPTAPTGSGHQVGDTWFKTDAGNKIHRWNGSTWTDVFLESGALGSGVNNAISTANTNASNALTNAANAQTAAGNAQDAADQAAADAAAAAGIANSKGKVIIQNSAPAVADRLPQNLWIDTTSGNNTPKRWNGSTWVAVTDKAATDAAAAAVAAQNTANSAATAAANAATAAGNAQTTANGKNTVWYQSSAPSGSGHKLGDLWFNTSMGNRPSRWNGSAWTLAPFGDAAIANLDAGTITAGTLNAARIGANSIDTTKLLIQGANLVPNPTFETLTGWTVGGGLTPSLSTTTRGRAVYFGRSVNGERSITSQEIYVAGDTTYTVGGLVLHQAGSPMPVIRLEVIPVNSSGVDQTPVVVATHGGSSTNWTSLYGQYTVPSNTYRSIRFRFVAGATTATSGNDYLVQPRIVQAAVGEMIVDGAIVADKIATNAITGTKLADGSVTTVKIADTTITNAKITDGTITNAKIANLDAGKITTGTINAARIASGSIDVTKLTVTSVDNFIENGGFEITTPSTRWTLATGSVITTSTPRDGARCLQHTTSTSARVVASSASRVKVEPGESYRLEGWVRMASGTSVANGITLRVQYSATETGSLTTASDSATLKAGVGTTYQKISGVWTAPANANWALFQVVTRDTTSGRVYRIDDVGMFKMSSGNLIVDGAIDGKLITGATIRTAASGQRLILDSGGLKAYNTSGLTATLHASSGGIEIGKDTSITSIYGGTQFSGLIAQTGNPSSSAVTSGAAGLSTQPIDSGNLGAGQSAKLEMITRLPGKQRRALTLTYSQHQTTLNSYEAEFRVDDTGLLISADRLLVETENGDLSVFGESNILTASLSPSTPSHISALTVGVGGTGSDTGEPSVRLYRAYSGTNREIKIYNTAQTTGAEWGIMAIQGGASHSRLAGDNLGNLRVNTYAGSPTTTATRPIAFAHATGIYSTSNRAVGNGGGVNQSVTLPTGRFTQPPMIQVTPYNSGRLQTAVLSGATTSSFTVRVDNFSGANVGTGTLWGFYWTATQMTSSSASG